MLGIKNIGTFIPDRCVDNISRASLFDRPEEFIRDKIGFFSLPRLDQDKRTSDMCVEAFNNLQLKENIDLSQVECIVVCTQNPDDYGLPHTSSIVHEKLNFDNSIASFDISLGCSGYVYSLNIVQSFMQANGMHTGLLFTADPYSKVLNPDDYITELIFGDAATCTLISNSPKYSVGKTLFGTEGKNHGAIAVSNNSGYLSMNGQDVFKFTMKVVPKQILACLEQNGISTDEISLVLLHQASKYIVDNMTKKLKIAPDKIPFEAQKTGNTVSSTIPIMLSKYLEEAHPHILLSGFGVGLSWASTVIKKM